MKLILLLVTTMLFSCTTNSWNKDAAKKWCMKDNKKNIDDGAVTVEEANKICDCLAEKMYAKYKSEKELYADKYNQMIVGKACIEALEIKK